MGTKILWNRLKYILSTILRKEQTLNTLGIIPSPQREREVKHFINETSQQNNSNLYLRGKNLRFKVENVWKMLWLWVSLMTFLHHPWVVVLIPTEDLISQYCKGDSFMVRLYSEYCMKRYSYSFSNYVSASSTM